MLFGLGFAGSLNPQNASQVTNAVPSQTPSESGPVTQLQSLDEQLETLKKLKELVDMGILTQDEFDAKKKQVLGL